MADSNSTSPRTAAVVAVIEELFTRLDAIEVVLERLLDRTDVLNISLSEQVLNKDWPIEKLEDIATLKAGPFGSALKKESYVSAGYKIYGQEQVLQNDPYYGDYFIDHEKYKELESCAIAPGDVLISLVGTIGKTLVVPDDAAAGIINPRLIRIRPDSAAVSSGYVSAFLEAPSTQARLFLQSHGGTMSILNSRMLKPLEVPLPPLVDQVRIVEDLDAAITQVESLKAAVQGLLERTGMFRLSVLAEAFAGRLVPQDSADEPASVLLERVRETVG